MGLFQNGYVPHLRKHIFSQDVSLFRKFNMGIPFLPNLKLTNVITAA